MKEKGILNGRKKGRDERRPRKVGYGYCLGQRRLSPGTTKPSCPSPVEHLTPDPKDCSPPKDQLRPLGLVECPLPFPSANPGLGVTRRTRIENRTPTPVRPTDGPSSRREIRLISGSTGPHPTSKVLRRNIDLVRNQRDGL